MRKTREITTTDLCEFGQREREMAARLLKEYRPSDFPEFWDEGVKVMFNKMSGHVFLTNNEYQVLMMNGENLERFYSCPECGHEGFAEDMIHSDYPGCTRYLRDMGILDEDEDWNSE